MNLRRLFSALLLVATAGHAGETHRIALRAAHLLDVRRGTTIDDAVVVVEGNKIVSVGHAVPPGAEVVDLGAVTLLPGLFDMHTHLSVGGSVRLKGVNPMMAGPIDNALQGVENARATLMAGFTSVRECGANDFIDVSLKNAIERGAIVGPRITPSGNQISMTGGHGDNVGFPEG